MWLRVLTGARAGKTVQIASEEFVVGSDKGCGLVLPDRGVGERHARFVARAPGAYELEDLGSSRGTFVDRVRIEAATQLRGNEELCFGDTFAALSRDRPDAARRKRRLVVSAAAATVLAAAGITAGVLAPRTGGPDTATVLASAPPEQAPRVVQEPPSEPATGPGAEEPPPPAGSAETQPQPDPPATEAAPPVVVEDDFSDPTSGFEVFEDGPVTAGYDGGEYSIAIDDASWYATADSGRALRHPTVRVTVLNPERSSNAGFGIVCHYLGPRDFDALAVGTNGTYAILRQRSETLTVLTGGGEWASSPDVPVAAERYRLRADCGDRRLRLYVNGQRLDAADAEATGGTFGLFAAGRAEFRFDDLVARAAG